MIAYLRGKTRPISAESMLICPSDGIGYEVVTGGKIPISTAEARGVCVWHVFGASTGEQVLYGFVAPDARELSIRLSKEVRGVGPKLAARIVQCAGMGGLRAVVKLGEKEGLKHLRSLVSRVPSKAGPEIYRVLVDSFDIVEGSGVIAARLVTQVNKVLKTIGLSVKPETVEEFVEETIATIASNPDGFTEEELSEVVSQLVNRCARS